MVFCYIFQMFWDTVPYSISLIDIFQGRPASQHFICSLDIPVSLFMFRTFFLSIDEFSAIIAFIYCDLLHRS